MKSVSKKIFSAKKKKQKVIHPYFRQHDWFQYSARIESSIKSIFISFPADIFLLKIQYLDRNVGIHV